MGNPHFIDTSETMKLIILMTIIATAMAQGVVPTVNCVNNKGTWVPTKVTTSSRRLQGMVYYACPYVIPGRRRLQVVVPNCTSQAPTNARRMQGVAKCAIVTIDGFKFQCKTNPTPTVKCNPRYK